MNLRKSVIAATAAVSLVVIPTIAQAAPQASAASKLSVRSAPAVRQGVRVSKASKQDGGSVIIALLAAAAVVGGIVVAADGTSKPKSP
jgi:uncharacterized Zn-binding protein involved in type VI secretion